MQHRLLLMIFLFFRHQPQWDVTLIVFGGFFFSLLCVKCLRGYITVTWLQLIVVVGSLYCCLLVCVLSICREILCNFAKMFEGTMNKNVTEWTFLCRFQGHQANASEPGSISCHSLRSKLNCCDFVIFQLLKRKKQQSTYILALTFYYYKLYPLHSYKIRQNM